MIVTDRSANLSSLSTDLLVLALTNSDIAEKKGNKKSQPKQKNGLSFSLLNSHFSGFLKTALETARFKTADQSSFFFTLQHSKISSLLAFGFDDQSSTDDEFSLHQKYRNLGSAIITQAKKIHAKSISISAENLDLQRESLFCALVEGLVLGGYEYTAYKSKKDSTRFHPTIAILNGKRIDDRLHARAQELCAATSLARDLINMPPNVCTPAHLVSVAKDVAQKGKLKLQVFDKSQLQKMGAFSLLSVAKGSSLPPYLIKLVYQPPATKGSGKTKVISIVGKGVTFDTGGYSLKPADGMIGMKGDMAGAACVLAVMQAVSALKPNVEVRGYIPTTENMVNGEATRVGDIVTAMNGKTIEILNTDAEGRLILADALTLACRDKPSIIIDVATLTGACMVALGMQYAGIFSDDQKLTQDIISTGAVEGERYWPLPLAPEYAASIKSTVADLKNIAGNRWGGATIAGLFLKEFVSKDVRWAHLDIAGPSDSDSDRGFIKTGGVGFGVRTLTRFILNQR